MVGHLSPSSMDMLFRCGMQFHYRYLEGLVIPPGISAVRGTAVHAGVETSLRQKMEGESDGLEGAYQSAVEALNREWERGVRLLPEEMEVGEAEVKNRAQQEALWAVKTYEERIKPNINPVELEKWWEVQVPGFPFTVKGRIDILEPRGVRDLKTGSRLQTQADADKSSQLTWYHLAEQAINGTPPDYVAIDTVAIGKREVKVETLTSRRDMLDVAREIKRLEVAADMIDRQIFPPAQPDHWCCTPKWCGYWNRCPFGARKETKVSFAVSGRRVDGEEEQENE